MIVSKIVLAASAAALMSTPAWALPGNGHGPSTPVGPPSTTPNNTDNPGAAHRHSGQHGKSGEHHGKSHKCMPHKVAYVASGTLASTEAEKFTLKKDEGAETYSGTVTVEVTRTNHHAAADKGKTVEYKVSKVRLTLGVEDVNKDGTVGLDDLAKGDQVKLIGKITVLAKKCPTGEFTSTTTIRKIVINGPATASSDEGTTKS